jgi:hypothetical protein
MEEPKSNAALAIEALVAYQRCDGETLRRLIDPDAEICSGIETDREFGWLYEIEGGRATRFHLYETAERAVEAAGQMAGE